MLWLLILAGGAVALAFFVLMDVATLPARQRSTSIRRAAGYGKSRAVARTNVLDDGTFKDRALVPMKTGLARAVLRISPRASVETVTNKLLAAGLNRKVSPTTSSAAGCSPALQVRTARERSCSGSRSRSAASWSRTSS